MPDATGLTRAVRLALDGDWQAAHALAQEDAGRDGAWVHAWLHRMEGDLANAGYWYARAGREMGRGTVAEEGEAILRELAAR